VAEQKLIRPRGGRWVRFLQSPMPSPALMWCDSENPSVSQIRADCGAEQPSVASEPFGADSHTGNLRL
jgi:hypothetical protein